MRFFNFLTSRGFAIIILCVSLVLLIVVNRYPGIYSELFLVIPAFLFLSIAFCATRKFLDRDKKSDIKFIGSMVFHVGMLVAIAATATGFSIRFFAVFELPQDMDVNIDNTQFVSILSTPIGGHVPFISMRLNRYEVKYEKEFYPVEYAAGITIEILEETGYRKAEEVIKVNQSVWRSGYQFVLADRRLSPQFVIRGSRGKAIFDGFVNISNSTDSEDTLTIKDAGLTLYTRFFPDVYKEGNKYGTRSTQPKNPAFGIKVVSDKDPFKDIWKGVLKPGEKHEFSGMMLEFAELKPVAVIQVVKDPAYYGIFAGWIVIVAGLLIRYVPLRIKHAL